MSNKSKICIWVTSVIIIGGGAALWTKYATSKSDPAKSHATSHTALDSRPHPAKTETNTAETPSRITLYVGGIPYKNRINILLSSHPEFTISQADAQKLQDTYNAFTAYRKRFEVALAEIKKDAGTSLVNIPAYPNDGARILAEFQTSIRENLQTVPHADAFSQILCASFIGDNEGLGKNAQKLIILATPDNKGFEIKHERIIIDAKTGTVSGIGSSINQVSQPSNSVYEGLEEFFP